MSESFGVSRQAKPVASIALLELLGLLLDGSSALVGLKDIDGNYVFANRELESWFGLGTGGLFGRNDGELMPEDVAAALRSRDKAVADSGRPARSFDRFVTAGRELECATVRFPYPGEDGHIVGTGFVAIDIREHKMWNETGSGADAALAKAQRTIAELSRAVEDMQLRANTDKLTGILNRARIEENAHFELLRFERYGHPVSLLFIDIDHFKQVNDSHGHAAGDQVLRQVCDIVRQCMRTTDLLGRWGGEEFLLLLPNTGLTSARLLAERIRHAVHESQFDGVGRITASFGVAEGQKSETWEEFVGRADAAMYRAKNGGRNRVEMSLFREGREGTAEHVAARFVHLIWHDAYASGNARIDAQHRSLFDHSNSLITAVIEGRPREEVAPLVQALIAESVAHFKSEEEILRAVAYPGAAEHVDLHLRLLDQAIGLARKYEKGKLGIGELFSFLAYDLVAQHMLADDRKFFPYLVPAKV